MKQIKCSECNKEYDSKLKVCPHCGFDNKNKKILRYIWIGISILLCIISIKSIISGVSDIEMQEYFEKYGSQEFGKVAYYLDKFRFDSLIVWITSFWIATYLKNKNFILSRLIKVISIILLIITQILPLGYAVYVKYNRVDDVNYQSYTSEYCYKEDCTNKRLENDIYCSLHQLITIKED